MIESEIESERNREQMHPSIAEDVDRSLESQIVNYDHQDCTRLRDGHSKQRLEDTEVRSCQHLVETQNQDLQTMYARMKMGYVLGYTELLPNRVDIPPTPIEESPCCICKDLQRFHSTPHAEGMAERTREN